jgi:hypothetical protein
MPFHNVKGVCKALVLIHIAIIEIADGFSGISIAATGPFCFRDHNAYGIVLMINRKIFFAVVSTLILAVTLFFFLSQDSDAGKSSRFAREHRSGTNAQPDASGGAADDYASTPADVALSPLDRLDNEQEIKRMREHLPGNGFIPGEVGET